MALARALASTVLAGGVPLGRALGWFWLTMLSGASVLALVLQMLGAPPTPSAARPDVTPDRLDPADPRPGRGIVAPIAALQEPLPGTPDAFLPRIAADGRMPMGAYAAPFNGADRRPRIGILLAGIGLSAIDSEAAIRDLPPGVSLAFSPYARRTAPLLEAARAWGHELLISLPLEPQGAPLHDAGDQALLVGATAEQNARRLDWSLSRIGGYVGATGALGALRGERFAEAVQPMRNLLEILAGRGLLYIDPRPGGAAPTQAAGRSVDLVIDAVQQREEIERSLYRLEQAALENGSALGLAGSPVPVTVGLLANWVAGLEERGFVLAPVTALVSAPPAHPPAIHPSAASPAAHATDAVPEQAEHRH